MLTQWQRIEKWMRRFIISTDNFLFYHIGYMLSLQNSYEREEDIIFYESSCIPKHSVYWYFDIMNSRLKILDSIVFK